MDSYAASVRLAKSGNELPGFMAQVDHSNWKVHVMIANEIMKWL